MPSIHEEIGDLLIAVDAIDEMLELPCTDKVELATRRDCHLARIAELESPESDMDRLIRLNG